ncbi:MAG: type III secretion system chaperone [Verrucomicrobium sp.]|nr:type III secretion system chaperone [Verrucomicrobium sp.]
MSDIQATSSLLTEVAPILNLEALVQHETEEDGSSWDLVFDDDLMVQAFHQEDVGRLVFTADVGTPPPLETSRVHKLLLEYNYLWRETSGVRMALEPPEGTVVMIYDVTVDSLDGVTLRNILENFANAARAWKAMVTTAADSKGEGHVTDDDYRADSPVGSPMIRV